MISLSKPHPLFWIIGGSALLLFGCSSLRHVLFQSSAFDLGYFDQAIYLISQGQTPIVSFWGYHFMGGHADWVLYGLALLYKIYPNVHWLFAVQAIALALGALPTYYLARQAGLKEVRAIALAWVYLLYPLVFNINLFDFHAEVMALPAMLWAIFLARQATQPIEQLNVETTNLEPSNLQPPTFNLQPSTFSRVWFCLAIAFILGCRDALSLTVAAMGFWLLVFEKRRWYGFVALLAGIAWFLIATQVIIPAFRPGGVEAVGRYAYLGNSVLEIAINLLLKPGLILGKVFSLGTLGYLGLLVVPLIWGLSLQHLTPLVAAIPTLAINILSESPAQRDLVHQYSLPLLPFLLVAVISTLAAGKGWLQNPRWIILWSFVAFLALAKYGYFGSIYLDRLDTWQATREAITQVQTKGDVLTAPHVAPHLTHRPIVKLATVGSESADLAEFEYVLLDTRHPGFGSTPQVTATLLERLKTSPEFQLTYRRDDVYVFRKKF